MDRASLITVSVILPIGSSLVMSNPVISNAGWIYRAESNEEYTGFRQERMSQCLLRDLIPNKITGQCVEVNTQGSCKNGERSVLAMNDKCLTTKCVKNEDDTKCYGGTLPFKGECYDLNKEIGCDIATQEVDLYAKTHKYRLLVDFFGEGVSCGCNNEYGFVPHKWSQNFSIFLQFSNNSGIKVDVLTPSSNTATEINGQISLHFQN